MKVLAIILSGLVLQTSASFFDELRGAVSSVESSFGQLLNDVIYDVKETIDCTLMAVEQALASGVFRDPAEYETRCGGGTQVVEQPPPEVVAVATEPPPPPVQEPQYITSPLTKKEHIQVDSSILNVDEVLCDVLKKEDTLSQLESIKLALKNETERLTEISELLKKQLEELSAEVKLKFKAIELQTSEPSVESIWSDIQLLHEIEHRHKNTDEAKKISHVLDQILSILDANEEDRSAADDYKIQEIMRKLSRQTKGGDSDIWKDLKNHPKDFRDYAKKIFDENRSTVPPDYVTYKPESEGKKSVTEDAEKKDESDKKDDHTQEPTDLPTVKPKRKGTTTTTTKSPFTIEELAAQYGSLIFDENRSTLPPDYVNDKPESEGKKSVPEDAEKKDESDKKDDHTQEPTDLTTVKPKRKRTTTTTTKSPFTIEELAAQFGSLIFDENRSTLPPDYVNDKPESEGKKSVPEDAEKKDESDKKDDHTQEPTEVTTVKPKRKRRKRKRTTTTTVRPFTIEELAAQYGSLFDVMPDNDSIENKEALESAKRIIEDNKLNKAVINSLDLESSKYARNVFDDPELLKDFNK